MGTLLKYEIKSGIKNLLIWMLSVGGMGLLCIVLYKSMEDSMADMAQSFSSMGAFADALGMSKLSIATVKGYFATEIGTIHALGSSMFAAAVATVMLSKEEDGHTAEFTYTLPLARYKIVIVKFMTVIMNLVFFTVGCALLYQIGFMVVGEGGMDQDYIIYLLSQLMMNVEIASVCFVLSAVSKKNKMGIGIGFAMIMYVYDLMARVVPDLENYKIITPFSYANATDIFLNETEMTAYVLGAAIIVITAIAAGYIYTRRDLAS